MKALPVLIAIFCFAACSRQGTQQPADPPATPRGNLDGVLVQKAGEEAAAADKATRESLLNELNGLLDRLEKAENLAEAFRIVESIEDLGHSIAGELAERVPKLPPLARIAGWRAVWMLGTLENKGWDLGVHGLLAQVTGEGDARHRVAAAEVLGAVASTRHEAILRKALHEQVFEPDVRVQLAIALWRSSRDASATKVLNDMLASDNDSFRIMAALALGEINQLTPDSTPILERLADEPTIRGRAAKRALDYGREVKRLDAIIGGREPGKESVRIDARRLDTVERMIKERFIYPDAVAGRKLLYAAASGMLNSLDPYTCLLEDNQLRDAAEIRRFAVPTLGLMLGSARIQENRHLRLTRVLSVKPGSPADRAGLQPGDRIYRVVRGVSAAQVRKLRVDMSGLPNESVGFQELPLDEAISQFQGAIGTTLGMQTFRDDWLLSRWVHATHEAPQYEAVSHETLPGEIGMLHVVELNASSPARVKEALANLREQGVAALILDLRNCAGGSVEAATQVAALFLPADTLVAVSLGRSEELAPKTEYKTGNAEPDTSTPLVVLVNGGTADAGEVLAGALREHQRARVTGQRTFGRAIVQELIPLTAKELEEDNRKAALLLTVARFHGPVSGMAWYDRGVEPDVVLTPRLFEGWIYDQFEQAMDGDLPSYLDKLIKEAEPETLNRLARGDGRSAAAWPGLDELYGKLGLQLEREDLRYLVRREIRERLIDQGADINRTDLQEDYMFTGAVKEAARLAKIDLTEIPEYAVISK